MQADRVMEGRNLFTKAKDMGLGALAKGSEFILLSIINLFS